MSSNPGDWAAIERRIDRLESRHAIAQLITDYGMACDDHDMAKLMTLFTETAVMDSPSGLLAADGRDAIEAMFLQVLATRGPSFHWSHDQSVWFNDDDVDRATGLVLSHAETTPNGTASVAAMRYADEYQRDGGRWLFQRRTLHFLYYLPVMEYSNSLSNPLRVFVNGERLAADYPEALPAWKAFFGISDAAEN